MIDLQVSKKPHPLKCLGATSPMQLLEKQLQHEWAFRRQLPLSTTEEVYQGHVQEANCHMTNNSSR